MAEIRKRIIFHGRVQGVGFRYRSKYFAMNLGLKGWVQNEYDGTVVMEVQGTEKMINELLIHLNCERGMEIRWMDSREIPLGTEKSFSVR